MPDLTIFRGVQGVETRLSQGGRNYWKITDDTNFEWTSWEPNVATTANQLVQGGLTQMLVRIAPAKDPAYGMNYTLRQIAPAPAGAQPTPAGAEMQQAAQIQATPQPVPQPAQMMPLMQQTPQQQPTNVPLQPQGALPSGPIRTLGQGGNFSDADITRMARSTAVEAATQLAIAFKPDFSGPEEEFDWMKFWLCAEALSKHIVHRAHEGWVPGQELEAPEKPSNEQQVLAEVQAQFGEGLVTQGLPEPPEPLPVAEASADNAGGGEVEWGE
jgi:hypothetical protein